MWHSHWSWYATSQIPFCKSTFSCSLKHTLLNLLKCEHINNFISMMYEIYRKSVNKIMHVKQKFMKFYKILVWVYLVAHETLLLIELGFFPKSKNLCFTLKCTILYNLNNIYRLCGVGIWHPHVKYLSDQTILKFLHKLACSYKYTWISQV